MGMKVESLLAYTLIDMCRTTPLDKISVTDILRESGISRTSFYSRFHDKNHLISWIYLNRTGIEEWRGYDRISSEENYKRLVRYYKGLQANRDFFYQACTIRDQNCLFDYMIETEFQFEIDFFREWIGVDTSADKQFVRKARYHANGQMHIIFSWLRDLDPLTPEEMASWNIETKIALFKDYLSQIDGEPL